MQFQISSFDSLDHRNGKNFKSKRQSYMIIPCTIAFNLTPHQCHSSLVVRKAETYQTSILNSAPFPVLRTVRRPPILCSMMSLDM